MDTTQPVTPTVTVGEVNAFLEEHHLVVWADKTLRDHFNKLLGGLGPLLQSCSEDKLMEEPLPEALLESFNVLKESFARKAMAK